MRSEAGFVSKAEESTRGLWRNFADITETTLTLCCSYIYSIHSKLLPPSISLHRVRKKNSKSLRHIRSGSGFGFSYVLRTWCSLATPCMHLLLLSCDSLAVPCLKCKSALFAAPWLLR
jgi:hypothetical protein